MKRYIIAATMAMAISAQAMAIGIFDNLTYYARAGYALGGTAPLGMPAEIRGLNKFSVKPNITLALDAYKPLGNGWGVLAGFHYENKNMKTDADVKNYHMEITRGGETLEGLFTGNVDTNVKQWMWTLPILATYELGSQFRLKFGPYGSLITSKNFTGAAYDGYLRKGNPTGDKVLLGHEEGQRGTYDFSKDMRNIQWGIKVGCDYHFTKHWGATAEISWGTAGIFKRDFHTIEQTMYPIYGTIGLAYKLK